jgi:hypothetical protein
MDWDAPTNHSLRPQRPSIEAEPKPLSLVCREPGVQIRVQRSPDGSIRLEQVAFSRSAGWYVQKTFAIPAELLPSLLLDLQKANCLNAKHPGQRLSPTMPLRLHLAE